MAIYLGNQMIGINGIAQESGNAFVTLNTLNANTNTTYIAPSGTAYSQVNVDVPPTINYGVLRPDATLVKSIKQNYLLMEDEKITNTNYTSSFPAYSTSSITLRTGSGTLDTISLDMDNYNYYIMICTLTYPIYNNVSTKGKGRTEYHFSENTYELIQINGNVFQALLDNTYSTSSAATLSSTGSFARLVYWSSGTAVTIYNGNYGTYQTVTAPTYSSGTISIKDTNVGIRGSASYFSSTYYNAISDIKVQNIFDIYKVSKNTNTKGWNNTSIVHHIANCIANDGILT